MNLNNLRAEAFREHFRSLPNEPKVGSINFELLKNEFFTQFKNKSFETMQRVGITLDIKDEDVDLDPVRLKQLVDFTHLVDLTKGIFESFIPDKHMCVGDIKCFEDDNIIFFFSQLRRNPITFVTPTKRLSQFSNDEIDDLFHLLGTDDLDLIAEKLNSSNPEVTSLFRIGVYFTLKKVLDGYPLVITTLAMTKDNCFLKHIINTQFKNVMKSRCNVKVGRIKFDLLEKVVDDEKEKRLQVIEKLNLTKPKEKFDKLNQLKREYDTIKGLVVEFNPANSKEHPTNVLFPESIKNIFTWINKTAKDFIIPTKKLSELTDDELNDILEMVGIRPKLLANEICKPANQSDFYMFIVGYYFSR